MTTYFVTGATGFIGRHLVERLLEREGDIHVLVREGSREKLDELRPVGQPTGSSRSSATSTRRSSASTRRRCRKIDHFFHLAAIYDMGADETRNALLNVGGTQNAIDLANALDVGTFHHMSSIAVAGLYDEGTFNEDMFDEGQKLAHPYHRTKFESEKLVRERVKAPWRVYRPSIVIGDSPDRRDGQDRRPVLLLQADPEGPAHAAGVVPADLARVGLDEHRPGRLRRRRRRPHRAQRGPRRPGLPHRRPQGPARRRGAEHVRRGRPRAQGRDADRQPRDAEPAQGRDQLRAQAAGAQADPRADAGRPRDPGRGRRVHRAHLPLRRARHPARAARHGHHAPAAHGLRRRSSGTTGSARSTPTSTRTARSRARSTARRS